jgi:phage terminase Nu1 subunit (DNA packaging protein)
MSSQAECAIHLFCSPQWFRELIARGVITRQPPNGYDLDQVRRETLAHPRSQAAARGAGDTLAAERAGLARAQKQVAQLKAMQLRGAVVEVEEVAFAVENRYALVKEKLLSIPGKIADELTHRERHDVVEVLRRKVIEALDELSAPARIIEEAGGRPDMMARLIHRFDLAHRAFGPAPTRYQVEAERQHLRRHRRVVRLSHYKTGDPWARR